MVPTESIGTPIIIIAYPSKVLVPNCMSQHFRIQWSISYSFLKLIWLVMLANLNRKILDRKAIVRVPANGSSMEQFIEEKCACKSSVTVGILEPESSYLGYSNRYRNFMTIYTWETNSMKRPAWGLNRKEAYVFAAIPATPMRRCAVGSKTVDM